MIPKGSLEAGRRVMEFSEYHIPRKSTAPFGVVCRTVLFPTEQDVSVVFAADPCQKPAVWGAEGQSDSSVGAGSHQCGRCAGVGKTDNGLQGMERITGDDLLVFIGEDIFSL